MIITDTLLINIIDKIILEDKEDKDIFEKVDKQELLEYLSSRKDILPTDITTEELTRRIRKVMVVEAMSKLFDGDPEALKAFEQAMKMNKLNL